MSGFQKLKTLLDDPKITEIMINGSYATFIEVEGKKQKIEVTFDKEEIEEIIEEIFNKKGKRIDDNHPYGDVCLEDGSRVNVITFPLSRFGTSITIRKFSQEIKTLDDLIKRETLTKRMAQFLVACIQGKLNILFSGATGVGKTTTLEMLSYYIPEQERVITIEDTAELKLHHPNLVSLETRSGQEGREVSLRDLIKNSLRMRPDRIIVGEVRGEEALDMIQAMSTGHRGTLAVIHGNSPQEVVARLETLILSTGIKLPIEEVRKMIASTLDIIVQQERFPDGGRRITHITEVRGMERGEIVLQDLFVFRSKEITSEGKIKGTFKTVMRMYPRFFADFQRKGLLDERVFSRE